ncbi:MAG: flagellar protein FlaG [Methylococcales bacterium]|nr:flagellar protein FlaG [Methylococcales bacterium]
MSDINLNITPTTIPASTRSQSSGVAGESVQSAISAVRVADVSTTTLTANATRDVAKQQQLTTEGVKAAAAVGDNVLKTINKDLQFQVDDATKQVVVKIVNSKTGEVIRQIPSVEILDFIRVMKEQEANAGRLYQDKA